MTVDSSVHIDQRVQQELELPTSWEVLKEQSPDITGAAHVKIDDFDVDPSGPGNMFGYACGEMADAMFPTRSTSTRVVRTSTRMILTLAQETRTSTMIPSMRLTHSITTPLQTLLSQEWRSFVIEPSQQDTGGDQTREAG